MDYAVVHSGRRTIAIQIQRDGRVVVRAPYAATAEDIRRVVDSLIDGTFSDGGTGIFAELHDALLKGASWHKPDAYYVLGDFADLVQTRLRANREYGDRSAFARKCILNLAHAGRFSSDRTVQEYAENIWRLPLE